MKKSRISILCTAPIETSIDEITQQDLLVDVVPFIDVVSLMADSTKEKINFLASRPATVVFTSANAVKIVSSILANNTALWKIYSIAGNTEKLVIEAFGKRAIVSSSSDALSLAGKIINDGKKEVIFFCGDIRREDLPSELRRHNIRVNEIIIYNTVLTPKKISNKYDGILFFSPSAVSSFFSKNQPGEEAILFAIGNSTAKEIIRFSKNKIIISQNPDKKSVLQSAADYFHLNSVKF